MSTVTYCKNGTPLQSVPAGNTIQMFTVNNGPDFPITVWPVDSHYGPITFTTAGGISYPGGDPAVGWGYNVNFQVATEPQFLDNMEIDFSPSSGHFQAERYIQFNTSDTTGFCRPVSATYNRLSKTTSTGLSYKNGSGVGGIAIAGVEGGQQMNVVDGGLQITPNPYQVITNALSFLSAGTFSVGATGASSNITLSAGAALIFQAASTWQITSSASGQFGILQADEIAFTTHGGTNSAFYLPPTNTFIPNGDNLGSIGTNVNRWALLRGVVVTSGDLDLHDEAHGAHWTVREEKDTIVAFNQINGRWYKLAMIELSDEERAEYDGARPMRKGPVEVTHPEPKAKPLPLQEDPKPLPKPDRWEFWKHPYDRAPGTIGHRVRPGKPS